MNRKQYIEARHFAEVVRSCSAEPDRAATD